MGYHQTHPPGVTFRFRAFSCDENLVINAMEYTSCSFLLELKMKRPLFRGYRFPPPPLSALPNQAPYSVLSNLAGPAVHRRMYVKAQEHTSLEMLSTEQRCCGLCRVQRFSFSRFYSTLWHLQRYRPKTRRFEMPKLSYEHV